jgi:uncharacterized membrane-anchored protein YitT (DUF2179 family)
MHLVAFYYKKKLNVSRNSTILWVSGFVFLTGASLF